MVSSDGKEAKNFFSRFVRNPKGIRWPRSRSAITRNVRPPALRPLEGKSEGDLVTTWMKNLDWSIVLCAEESCFSFGRTRETREDALEEALAVCSERTVVLWAMHALGVVSRRR